MADLTLNVQTTTQAFNFNPDTLFVKILSVEMDTLTAQVYYELSDSTIATGPPKYIMREWIDKGTIVLPLSVIAAWKNDDGSPNVSVINEVISEFNLQLVVEQS